MGSGASCVHTKFKNNTQMAVTYCQVALQILTINHSSFQIICLKWQTANNKPNIMDAKVLQFIVPITPLGSRVGHNQDLLRNVENCFHFLAQKCFSLHWYWICFFFLEGGILFKFLQCTKLHNIEFSDFSRNLSESIKFQRHAVWNLLHSWTLVEFAWVPNVT